MDAVAQEILDFIRKGGTEVMSIITTVNSSGMPISRQVSTFVEDGWVTGTVSPPRALKALHIPKHPQVSYCWVKLEPSRPAKLVTMSGNARMITDPSEVAAFLQRREAVYGPLRGAGRPDQQIVQVTPVLVRAEGFVPGGPFPVTIRDFQNPVAERVNLE